ncbi:MAG: DNA repair protein RecO [Elusimicrobia bacterium CG1_02_63_36]|nr:MAG: DNA repair protein RecO [Elusimicrobia bacterium CG1_02_63_36]PIP81610.1 MAG: DNA repair protein RecO [Elusimicrobia bacterium CG22_combo_CG10-13_8_21_14_all_63_91]PJA16012.1 MAG: DNA repair protein RecO [Elusimicrobia bacterium CG_4_10_14_0_2_um_filter_63_34]PJB26415.1 MAG: DNA repair protein RecO [Elusimicrobia bacterium CG_4_9_14_3_um_filter_62_55]
MRGRQTVVEAVVIGRREHRETDRVAIAYTDAFGKVPVRFGGVNRPAGKLKAVSEPMVWTELRLYARHGAEFTTATGGSLLSSFPRIRSDFSSTLRGLEVCELLDRLTPMWKPNPRKLRLSVECLTAMDGAAGSPGVAWLSSAYALRLFKSAGFGLREKRVSEENRALWELLHEGPLEEIGRLPEDRDRQGRLDYLVRHSVERIADRPLRSAELLDRIARESASGKRREAGDAVDPKTAGTAGLPPRQATGTR